MAHPRSPWLRGLALVTLISGIAVAAFFLGPRNPLGPDQPATRPAPPSALFQLEPWLTKSEAAFPDLRPGTAKGISWARPSKQRTPWAVVYVHGFSATRLETAPVADNIAASLGANAFHTRLTGHGLTAEAMGKATLQDWLADITEAVHIGQQLGERVLLIGCSTGATLATWLALRPEGQAVAAHAFISPNFGPKDTRADLVNGPWGRQIAHLVQGPLRSSPIRDPREAIAWTNPYPTAAIFPMMALVKQVREADLSRFDKPVLMLYAEGDETVEPKLTREAFARIGSHLKTIEVVGYSKARGQHVLAGDIMDPEATRPLADAIIQWVRKLPPASP
jgi:alpha-beta hydrolase superfamily lysophospholipase